MGNGVTVARIKLDLMVQIAGGRMPVKGVVGYLHSPSPEQKEQQLSLLNGMETFRLAPLYNDASQA